MEDFQTERKAAIDRMQRRRDAAFLADSDLICGLPVKPLTPRLFTLLHQVQSVFVSGRFSPHMRENLGTEIRVFLWIVSPEYREGRGARRARRRVIAQVDSLDALEAITGIRSYLDTAFLDAPGISGTDSTPSTSFVAQAVDLLATEYGWHVNEIVDLPFGQFWQFRQAISQRKEDKPIAFNRELDQWQRDYMRGKNGRN